MAKLKLVIDKLDDVDEAVRPLYEEKDGKFHLSVDGIEDTTPLKTALAAAKREAQERRQKLEAWAKLGKTAEEIEQLLADEGKREMSEAERKGEWDKLKTQMNERHAADLAKKDLTVKDREGKISSLRSALERHLIDATATAAIAAQKGVPELLLPHVRKHVKVEESEDGQDFVVSVVDSKGGPRVNGKGEPLSISEFVAEMQQNEVFARAFEGTGSSGSGKRPTNGGGGGANPGGKSKKSEFKSEAERASFINAFPSKEEGLDAYLKLPA